MTRRSGGATGITWAENSRSRFTGNRPKLSWFYFDSIYSTFSEIEKSRNTGILKNGRAHLLCDEGRGGAGLVLPVGREDALGLVVAGQAVDPGLDENEPELGVLVLAVALQVLADAHGLLDLEIWRWNSNIKQLRVKGEQRLIEGPMLNKKP